MNQSVSRHDTRAAADDASRWPAYSGATAAAFVVTALLVGTSSIAIREAGLGPGANIALALLPLPGLAAIIVFGVKAIRRLDELDRKIQCETLAITFGVVSALLVTYGQFQSSGLLSQPERWTMLWPMMWAVYGVVFAMVRRRYV